MKQDRGRRFNPPSVDDFVAVVASEITLSSKVTTTSVYDALNRVTSRSYSNGLTLTNYYVYDVVPTWSAPITNVVGRLTSSSGGSSGMSTANTVSYDAMGRIVAQWEQTPSDAPNGSWVCSGYDLVGNLTSITPVGAVRPGNVLNCSAAAAVVSYTRDGANRLATVTSSLDIAPSIDCP